VLAGEPGGPGDQVALGVARSQWRDMDFDQQMANSAFLDCASNTHILLFDSVGFTACTFAELRTGPVALDDQLVSLLRAPV